MTEEATAIDPESPVRLRECLAALARHTDAHALRVEVYLGNSTRDPGYALTMTVTHSLGVEHELAIAPLLGKAFGKVFEALAKNAARAADSGGNAHD